MTAVSNSPQLIRRDDDRAAVPEEPAPQAPLATATLVADPGVRPLRRSALHDPLAGSQVDDGIQQALRRRAGKGQELPAELAGSMGEALGHDLSAVRVHADSEAGELASAVQSQAFTHGNDLYFAPGRFRPGSAEGQRLIAHELGHVVAQRTGQDTGDGGGLTVGAADHPAEAAADRVADRTMAALRRKVDHPAGRHDGCDCGVAPAPLLRRSVLRRDPETLESEPEQDAFDNGKGTFVGTKQEEEGGKNTTTHKAVTGAWSKNETEHDSFDGRTHRKGSTETSGLAGAEASIALIRTATEEELSLAFEAAARAGAFGSAKAEGMVERGPLRAGGSVEVSGGVGVSGGVSGSVSVDRSGKIPKLAAALEAFAKAGVEFNFGASGFVGVGPLEVIGAIEAAGFAGARAKASGSAKLSLSGGLELEGEVEAFAGAEVEAEASVTVKLGDQEVQAALKGEAMAGVKAGAKGGVVISLKGVEVSGKAEAFAGASAEGSGSLSWTHQGRTIFSATGTVSVDAGIGGKVEGTFVFRNGKLYLKFGAKAVFGIGGGVDLEAELDFIALGNAIYSEINNAINRATVDIGEAAGEIDRQPVVDQLVAVGLRKRGYEAYIADFRAYAAKKLSEGQNGIKKERVQEILDNRRGQVGMDLVYAETDEGIVAAAKEAFGPLLKSIAIQGGRISKFLPAPFTEVGGIRAEHGKSTALADFKAELAIKVAASQSGGSHLPDAAVIGKVVTKHYAKVSAATTPDEADAAMASAVEEAFAGLISGFTITGGVPGSFKFDARGVADKDASAATARKQAAQDAELAEIRTKCAQYAAKKGSQGTEGVKRAMVAKLIAPHATTLLQGLDSEAITTMDGRIAAAIKEGLGAAVTDVMVSEGNITAFAATDAATLKSGVKADKDAAARTRAYETAAAKFAEYATKKTTSGSNGIKPERVQAIVATAFKTVGSDPTIRAEADAELTEKAKAAFGALVNHLEINDGVVTMVVSQTRMAAAKEKAASDSARVGSAFGDEDGNKRRYNVRNAVHDQLVGYFARIKANPRGVPTLAEVRQIVTKSTRKFADELKFEDAKAELIRSIAEASEGVFNVNSIDDSGAFIGSSVDMSKLMELRQQDADDRSDQVVLGALAAPLKSYAAKSYKTRPTLSTLQAVIDKAARAWASSVTATPVDELITRAISEAFEERIKEVVVSGGMVTVLRMAS